MFSLVSFYFTSQTSTQTGMSSLSSNASDAMAAHMQQMRRLGTLEEEQVELGQLLGRGSFGRVYRGAPFSALACPAYASEPMDWKAMLRRSTCRTL